MEGSDRYLEAVLATIVVLICWMAFFTSIFLCIKDDLDIDGKITVSSILLAIVVSATLGWIMILSVVSFAISDRLCIYKRGT